MVRYLLILCCVLTISAYGQEKIEVSYQSYPLKEVFADLRSKTGTVFSFSENIVRKFKITIEKNSYSLEQIIGLISEQTGLDLKTISPGQIIVRQGSMTREICGFILDASDQSPLAFATISIEGNAMGTITDDKGFFSLSGLEPNVEIKIAYVGFYDLRLNLTDFNDGCPTFELGPRPEALDEVIIYAYLNTGVNKNSDGSFTMVNEDMNIFPGLVEPDILQSIQFVPGISSLDESASGIQIRGGSADQNLMLFDGIRMYNTGHFFGMLSLFNPYVIDHAKVYRSGAPAKYGDRVSGVVDISSGEEIPEKLHGGFGVNGTHADIFLKTPISENVGLYVSGRRSYTDFIQTPTFNALSDKVFQNTRISTRGQSVIGDGDGDGDDDDDDDDDDVTVTQGTENFFFQDASFKLLMEPSKEDNLYLSGLYSSNDLDFSQSEDEDEISDRFIIENKGASIGWNGKKGKYWYYNLSAFYSNFDSDYDYQIVEDLITEEASIRRNTVEDYGGSLTISRDVFQDHRVSLGYQYSFTDVYFRLFHQEETQDNFPDRDYDITRNTSMASHAMLTEYQWFMKNRGFVRAGLRGSVYSLFDDIYLEPRLNMEYPLTTALRLKGTYEKRYQPISQLVEFEDIQLRLENSIWTLSNNTDIPILSSNQFSGGILFNAQGWTAEVEGYYKEIDGITSVTNGFITTSPDNISVGSSTITGMDFLLKRRTEQWDAWLSYTFNDIKYLFEEIQPMEFDGNNDIAHNLRMSLTYKMDALQLSTGWMFRTGGPFTPIEDFDSETYQITYGDINSSRLPNYHRLDVSALYAFGKGEGVSGSFGLSLNNVYSRRIPLSIYYRLDTNPSSGEGELIQVQQLSQGLTPNFVFRLNF